MIIYGARNRNVTIASGQFECPRCKTTRPYEHINVVRILTLFFIPTVPLGRVGSYIECKTCFTTFTPEQLIGSTDEAFSKDVQAQVDSVKAQTRQGRGCALVVVGAVITLAGCIMLSLLTAFQLTGTSDPLEGIGATLCLIGIIPAPLLAVGSGLLA